MLRLVIRAGETVQNVPVKPASELRIGAAEQNDVVVRAAGVSRAHMTVAVEKDRVIVRDLESKNGTWLQGRRVDQAVLLPGLGVAFGTAVMTVEDVSTSDAMLALRLNALSATTFSERGETGTGEPAGTPLAALRWARKVMNELEEGTLSIAERLPEAQAIAHVESLLLYRVVGSDLGVIGAAGPLPDDDTARAIAAGKSKDWWSVAQDDLRLAAGPAAGETLSDWQHEFLEFVLSSLARDENARSRVRAPREAQQVRRPARVIGNSPAMLRVLDDIARIAHSDVDVLLTGETGTGKELMARAIHDASDRAPKPFIAFNCTALAPNLLEAELFGIGRGVATGVEARPGLFAAADGGTIFLDEIGQIPHELQPKFLRVLEEREILQVGATRPKRINVRVISSTNKPLPQLVDEGAFRADLLYRLARFEIELPPLRERTGDVPLLVKAFLESAAAAHGKRIGGVSIRAMRLLQEHAWPGNVRELRNCVEAAVLRCSPGGTLQWQDFGVRTIAPNGAAAVTASGSFDNATLEERERQAISDALRLAAGNKAEAARRLGISRAGLYLKMKRYGLD